MSEEQPLLQSQGDSDVEDGRTPRENRKGWRDWFAERLETKLFHAVVITLISIDSVLVLVDLSYSFLFHSCTTEADKSPLWLEILSNISLCITYLFLVELLLFVWAFGPGYYSPFKSILHFCDGSVIIMTFVIDVVLKGRERELAALLILLRLIRFAAEAAVGVAELDEGTKEELHRVKSALAENTKALYEAQQEIQTLKLRLPGSRDGA